MNLEKEDLIKLVKGTSPYYSIFDDYLVKKCGNYIGGFHDKWDWNTRELNELNEKQLFELYTKCKESWK